MLKLPWDQTLSWMLKMIINVVFFLSILACLHPCDINQNNRVSNYRQYFNELNIEGYDFSNGFKCSGVHWLNDLNKLPVNVFESNFYQDQNKWRHKLISTEVSKNNSDIVIDLATSKNHYILRKKVDVFLGDHNTKFISRGCSNSYTSENMLKLHKQNVEMII